MIDDQSPPGSWANAIADREAIKRANKDMGERKNDTEGKKFIGHWFSRIASRFYP